MVLFFKGIVSLFKKLSDIHLFKITASLYSNNQVVIDPLLGEGQCLEHHNKDRTGVTNTKTMFSSNERPVIAFPILSTVVAFVL